MEITLPLNSHSSTLCSSSRVSMCSVFSFYVSKILQNLRKYKQKCRLTFIFSAKNAGYHAEPKLTRERRGRRPCRTRTLKTCTIGLQLISTLADQLDSETKLQKSIVN